MLKIVRENRRTAKALTALFAVLLIALAACGGAGKTGGGGESAGNSLEPESAAKTDISSVSEAAEQSAAVLLADEPFEESAVEVIADPTSAKEPELVEEPEAIAEPSLAPEPSISVITVGEAPASPAPVVVTNVSVTTSAASIEKGKSISALVDIYPANAADKTYTLRSSDESVLSPEGAGWIAVSGGSAELIATAANGVIGKALITVVVPVEAIVLDVSQIEINRGNSASIGVRVLPPDATDRTVKFSSNDEKIASVFANGAVFAASAGSAVITCEAGGKFAQARVTVVVPVTNISVTVDRYRHKIGETAAFTVRLYPEDATDKTFSVAVNGARAALTDNYISLGAAGTARITVTAANGVTDSAVIDVIDLAAYADEVFRLTNAERAKAGLSAYTTSQSLSATAALRAKELITKYSHTRPDGRDCFSAFKECGATYYTAGENIAYGYDSPAAVVEGWMNSQGHRENILNADFGRLGAGVDMDSSGTLYWSQNFTN